jgi:hypothetical protein
MGRGGKRPGAGRPQGASNKVAQAERDAIAASGLTPLEYMLQVMRDAGADEAKRLDAAKAAAPYCHARLSSVEVSGPDGDPMETVTRIELVSMRGNDAG